MAKLFHTSFATLTHDPHDWSIDFVSDPDADNDETFPLVLDEGFNYIEEPEDDE